MKIQFKSKVDKLLLIYLENLELIEGFCFLFLEVESSWTCILEGWKFLFLEVEGLWFMFWDVYLHILKKNSVKKLPFSLRVDS